MQPSSNGRAPVPTISDSDTRLSTRIAALQAAATYPAGKALGSPDEVTARVCWP